MSIKDDFKQLARAAKGSHKTVSDRTKIAERFAAHLKGKNIQIKSIAHLKSKHIESYVISREASGISKRTLQNEMAAVRQMLRIADREMLANSDRISNKALGISGATRDGTHQAMPDEKYKEVFMKLGDIDKGVQACAALERHLGLRSEEAVQANKSLATWAKQLERSEAIRVIFGTKGGRSRDVRPPDLDKAKEAINNALKIAKKQGGNLVDKSNLKSALHRHSYALRSVGAVAEYSPHSLRYAFARERFIAYVNDGFTKTEALAMTSQDLGHGDGRGRYIAQVYLK